MATTVTSNTGQVYNVADIINQVNARYAQGKTPDLVVKSALQLGLPKDFIMTLPGVDQTAFTAGSNLISSGAFAPTATGTAADIAAAAPVGSAMYNARLAQGLDPFGFPAEEVARLTAAGLYGAGRQYDPTGGTLSSLQQRAEEMGGQTFNQQIVPTGSNLTAADIAWLQQGKGMYGNPLYDDPTSPIQWALAGGIGVPATAFATTAAANALGLTNVSMAAADAAQLASQGLSEAQIANILQTSYNIPAGAASSLAFSAAEGGTPFEIAQFTGDVNFGTPGGAGPSVPTAVTSPTTTTPGTVTVTGQPAATTVSSSLPGVISGGLLTNLTNIPAPAQTVTVTGQPTTTTSTTAPADTAATLLQLPTNPGGVSEQVTVTGQRDLPSGVTTLPSTVTPAGTVNITGTRIPAPADDYISPIIPAVLPPLIPTAPTTIGPTTSTTTNTSVFNPSDILRLLGLAGITAAGSRTGTGTGTGTAVTPRSDANIGSTTPQFGDEYYSAVQRYYNTFMPQTPRDVAGPLQQWYENRYGAPVGAAPTTPTMISPGAGTGAVSGGMATPSSAGVATVQPTMQSSPPAPVYTGSGMMASAAAAPVGAQTVQDFMAAQPMAAPAPPPQPSMPVSAPPAPQPTARTDYTAQAFTQFSQPVNTYFTDLSKRAAENVGNARFTANIIQETLDNTPEVLGVLNTLGSLTPDLKVDDTLIRNLAGDIRNQGATKTTLEFLRNQQNIAGMTGTRDMSNPEWARYQNAINQLTPKAPDQDWYTKVASYKSPSEGGEVALWRDPKSGYGIGVGLNKRGVPDLLTFYNPSGVSLQSQAITAPNLYEYAERYGIDLSGVSELGRQLESQGIGYKPYQTYAGTGSDIGIDFADIARGGLGTAYDWTKDANIAAKGPQAAESLRKNQELAARLGIQKFADVTTETGISFETLKPQKDKSGNVLNFVAYNPATQVAAWFNTPQEAQEAARNMGGIVKNVGTPGG